MLERQKNFLLYMGFNFFLRDELMIKIELPFPISVNAAYGGGSGQRRFKSKRLKSWIASCPEITARVHEYPVHIHYRFYWPDLRARDGQNYMKVVLDHLVNCGVLVDDNYDYVASETWDHGGVDKVNSRVEIFIKVFENEKII